MIATRPAVKEAKPQLAFAPDSVLAPGIQSGIWYTDPDTEVVPPVMVRHCAEVAPRLIGRGLASRRAGARW